ncbi:undecaprenyldiphospho-muramoylpentapeptide beta-N-acetylglucosaminyltransferase [Alishewanella tabrizica]|uniref:UDP-N-acetylglucosamine--N-acetylmuramyl-(pentapeptide) pyrophosphoryl-undecaprenol N-acetylglucosamine transferase n=1 Tax=Alishewanella tabrizica TaxID=671278 RepID=A0ABQ2WGJ9_9ALTE|nr:undecaprenyldiphospho-muramoylpentapeptide beta-N-acetylglucosaminyltransferase [Alishewanella tabrizica]GGW55286.1 UDP-N-acetylglucosamine--N-acetylmuramyl-(pentapeptide) pyrophosphoryl-undecaprenol N-acetylglucosamine transferase [Alishewanella tabrizica]
MNKPRVLIMAGGTGGHIFPAQAVAKALSEQGWDIAWLGTADRMEAQLVPTFGWDFYPIKVAGLRGKGLRSLVAAPAMLWRSIRQARALIKQLQPQCVLGFGGYASGPGGLAAWLAQVPLLIHEQNAVAGSTNKLLARLAKKVLVAFPQAFAGSAKQHVVGNPVRQELLACRDNRPEHTELRILVIGGSLGAKALNEHLPAQFATLAAQGAIAVRHQTGEAMHAAVQASYAKLMAQGVNVEVSAFIHDMAAAYRWADVVVCRAGALTVSEVAAVGVAAIFVPLPSAIDDHQTANAKSLTEQNAGWLLPQTQLQASGIVPILAPCLANRSLLQARATQARKLSREQATAEIVALCRQVTGQAV